MIHITSLAQTFDRLPVQVAPIGPGELPGKRDTVLVIDDDPTMRLALACIVADNHRQIVLASSAEDALERLPLINPDIVLCDFLMEGINGREFCQRMKSVQGWRHVPVIVITRMDAQPIITDLLKSGADDVLVKPVRADELRARVLCGLRTRARYLELVSAARDHGGYAISVVA